MVDRLADELEALERQGWDSLCNGTGGDFYGDLMTADGLMVLANGEVMTRDDVAAALRNAPTWDSYGIEDLTLVELGQDSAAIVYRSIAGRVNQPQFLAAMSSVYTRVDGRWRLALYTQTPLTELV